MRLISTGVKILFLTLFLFLTFTGNMMLWLGFFGISIIFAIFFGRIYCGYVCPMNTLMEPIERLSQKLNIKRDKVPKWLLSGKLSWGVLILSILTVVFFKKTLAINIPILFILLIASLIITLRYKQDIFHNKICPFGILQRFAGKLSYFSKKVLFEKCIGCKLCEKVCPSNAIIVSQSNKRAIIDSTYCYQCVNCKSVCPRMAIVYRKRQK